MVVKSDNEPALLQLKKAAVARTAGVNCQPEESPVGEPESNGEAETAVREVKKQVRTLWSCFQTRLAGELPLDHPILAHLVEWAAASLTRFAVGPDGHTAWFRHKKKAWKGKFPEFGELVYYMPVRHGRVDWQR